MTSSTNATVVFLDDWTELPVRPECSRRYGHRWFPARCDYERALIDGGFAATTEEIWANPRWVAAIQRHWHQTGQTGCLFARLLSRRMSKQEWPAVVVSDMGWRDDAARRLIDDALYAAVACQECEIVSILFPEVVGVTVLKEMVQALANAGAWIVLEHYEYPPDVLLELRRPVTKTGALAWIMGFGPYSQWPPTRRGPVTELAVRVKPKPADLFPALNQDPAAAHLADASSGLNPEQTGTLLARTAAATVDVLGADTDHRSAARTTFSFPASGWQAA
jgi:hypothetical protein